MKRTLFVLAFAAACGGKSAPAPQAPSNTAASTEPAATEYPPAAVLLGSDSWYVDAGDAHLTNDENGATLETAAFKLTLTAWPQSDAFVRTAQQHLEALRDGGEEVEVLEQTDGGAGNFVVVARYKGHIDGTVLVPGGTDDAMCGFELPLGADYKPALAACMSLRLDELSGED
jgi:hypothetical protein